MDYIDNKIKEQIKQLEKLQSYKSELQEKNKKSEVNIEANINEIQKQVDDYKLYKELKNTRPTNIADYNKHQLLVQQLNEMELLRSPNNKESKNMCNNDYQLLLSQTILEIYKILNK
jgi:hypothetical protein